MVPNERDGITMLYDWLKTLAPLTQSDAKSKLRLAPEQTHARNMGGHYHQKYRQRKRFRISRNILLILCKVSKRSSLNPVRQVVFGGMENSANRRFRQIRNYRTPCKEPCSTLKYLYTGHFPGKLYPVLDQNCLISIPYPRLCCLKPFTAAHTHIAYIWEYRPPPSG